MQTRSFYWLKKKKHPPFETDLTPQLSRELWHCEMMSKWIPNILKDIKLSVFLSCFLALQGEVLPLWRSGLEKHHQQVWLSAGQLPLDTTEVQLWQPGSGTGQWTEGARGADEGVDTVIKNKSTSCKTTKSCLFCLNTESAACFSAFLRNCFAYVCQVVFF